MQRLADARAAVGTLALLPAAVLQVHHHIRTLTRMQRLADPALRQFDAFIEVCFQQVRMVRVTLPQQRQDPLVAQHRLPCRLQQLQPGGGQGAAEVLTHQVLQRIQLEQAADHDILQVGEATVAGQAQILDRDRRAVQAGLRCAIAQVLDRALIFLGVTHRTEVQGRGQLRGKLAEPVDQRLVDGIELVGMPGQGAAVALVLQPLPLEERGFVQRGRRVVVEFIELGRAAAVVRKIHAAIQVRLAFAPALRNPVAERLRYRQLLHVLLAGHDALDHVQRHRVQLFAGRFDVVLDLAQRERVVRALVPIRRAIDGVEPEPGLGRASAPVAALGNRNPLHRVSRRRWCVCGCCRQIHHGLP